MPAAFALVLAPTPDLLQYLVNAGVRYVETKRNEERKQADFMMRIESGKYSAGMFHPLWSLNERGQGAFRDRVTFTRPFEEPPKVIIAISGLDVRDEYPASVTADAERVAGDGFGLRIGTAQGGLKEVTLSWVAIGAA